MAAQTICMRDGLMEQKRQPTARKEQKEAEIDNNSPLRPGKARPAGLEETLSAPSHLCD
ncbi:MAG: hypothetical protein O9256_00360 [Rhizobiaceae bacterium]|nr:hypothetical protein [Rhizobiaceae bacterium]